MCVQEKSQGGDKWKVSNLNNALKNLIYPEYASRPGDIPVGELVVVFDADMQVGGCCPLLLIPVWPAAAVAAAAA